MNFIIVGAISAAFGVGIGAFGAHGLKSILSDYGLGIFETGVKYQFYHAFGMIAVGMYQFIQPQATLAGYAGWAFLIGTFLFSGSLYILALSGIKWLGAITPFGGVAFIIGWFMFAYAVWKS